MTVTQALPFAIQPPFVQFSIYLIARVAVFRISALLASYLFFRELSASFLSASLAASSGFRAFLNTV